MTSWHYNTMKMRNEGKSECAVKIKKKNQRQ